MHSLCVSDVSNPCVIIIAVHFSSTKQYLSASCYRLFDAIQSHVLQIFIFRLLVKENAQTKHLFPNSFSLQ